jgi:hypothetical protein
MCAGSRCSEDYCGGGEGKKSANVFFFSLVNRRGVAAPGVMFPRDVLDDFKIVAAGKDFIGRKRVFTRL